MKTIFGYTPEQIARMGKTTHDVDPEHKLSPINPNDGPLDPCIRGGEKILKDPQKKKCFEEYIEEVGNNIFNNYKNGGIICGRKQLQYGSS